MTAVTVTAGHIASGIRDDCEHCPVALALLGTFPDADYVAVGQDTCTIGTPGIYDTDVDLPGNALEFIRDFDDGGTPEPFTFELDYPAATP